jgi:itaconyl-CoA hydratase
VNISQLTGKDNYFEHFAPGQMFRHARGKTMTEMDNVLLTNLTMNSAHAHFNEDFMKDAPFGQRVTFGGITASLVIGIAAQDTAENALAEISMTGMRLKAPVFHGDTLYALTRVLSAEADPEHADAGIVRFQHWGINQREEIVCEAVRTVRMKRASHWGAA